MQDTASQQGAAHLAAGRFKDAILAFEEAARVRPTDMSSWHDLGLPWDERYMAFHEFDRDVLTASALQVREPMHLRSVGSWRPYGRWLGSVQRLKD